MFHFINNFKTKYFCFPWFLLSLNNIYFIICLRCIDLERVSRSAMKIQLYLGIKILFGIEAWLNSSGFWSSLERVLENQSTTVQFTINHLVKEKALTILIKRYRNINSRNSFKTIQNDQKYFYITSNIKFDKTTTNFIFLSIYILCFFAALAI